MKAIMISTKPQWVEKILNGEKTIVIRKTMPKCELPVKVYIYCTKGKQLYGNGTGETWNSIAEDEDLELIHELNPTFAKLNGKVVACFTLNEVEQYGFMYSPLMFINSYFKVKDDKLTGKELDYDKCSISKKELMEYANDGKLLPEPLYAWHIDDLQIYDTPRELGEFRTLPCNKSENACGNCKYLEVINTPNAYETNCYVMNGKPLTRPPQSWCYVEELEEKNYDEFNNSK